tara:strand:- start:24 stop:1142 length:1119 start_codon:yes stop_codon:yes gene_type:complete
MAVPSSGTLSQLGLAQEALYGTYGSGTITGPISIYDMVNGGDLKGSGNSYPTVNDDCTPNPTTRPATPVIPTLNTTTVSNITTSSAYVGGNNIVSSASVSSKGITWADNPTFTSSNTATVGSGTADFAATITGLSANTTYYVKAFAINSVGTGYGNTLSWVKYTPAVSLTSTQNSGNSLNLGCNAGSAQTWVVSGDATQTVTSNTPNFSYSVTNPAEVDIDITNPTVSQLYMTGCLLTKAIITNNVNLNYIANNVNSLTTIDYGSNEYLEQLYCDNNLLTSIDLEGCTPLRLLRAYNNTSLTSVTRMNNFSLMTYLDLTNTNLSSANKDLVYIDLNNNGKSNGTLKMDTGRTSASDSARTSLVNKGWGITEV